MQASNSWMRKRFRGADAKQGGQAAVQILSELRASRPPKEFGTVLSSFRVAAPRTYAQLFALGQNAPSKLVWAKQALTPVPLEYELEWAAHWLAGQSIRINSFREVAAGLQALVLNNELLTAKSELDVYVQKVGWSLWAVELRVALLQLSEGTGAQRAWLDNLQLTMPNSIPGLLLQMFSDRNDDTFSFEAVYGKCMSSFPRFESIAPWLVDYLKYRALARIDDPINALPRVLSRDITSSLIDYYEALIDALGCIVSENASQELLPVAAKLVSFLISDGYQDHRLLKLSIALNFDSSSELDIKSHPEKLFRTFYPGTLQSEGFCFPVKVINNLVECHNDGAARPDLVSELLKWGLNLRSLDIGTAVATSAFSSVSRATRKKALSFSVAMLSKDLCVDDIAAFGEVQARLFLRAFLAQQGLVINDDQFFKPSTWSFYDLIPDVGAIHLWLAAQLFDIGDFDELAIMTDFLCTKGPYWERQSAKLNASVYIRQEHLGGAVKLLVEWLQSSPRYALEFPSDMLFKGRKWKDFRSLDPVEVGIVAHYEFEAHGDKSVAYICKMACRSFLQLGLRDNVVNELESASPARKAQLVTFLRDVWIEQNLSICSEFESTVDVRKERMSIIQLLLEWDLENAQDYAEAIKLLTFDQTLHIGLERIDQTRVFVNESAITRWAEKELQQDYDRWRRMSEPNLGGRFVDEMMRQYALDQTNSEVLIEFANGKPSASDVLFIDIIDRLLKKFLLDPTDGFDTYLSVRIRHGSLRGTILGPLEEQGLLYSTVGFSQQAFEDHWDSTLNLSEANKVQLLQMMQEFSKDVLLLVNDFVAQRVQLQCLEKPLGAFSQTISPSFAKILAAAIAERPLSFHAFLSNAYFVFWSQIDEGLLALAEYLRVTLANSLHERIELLIQELRLMGQGYSPLISTLTAAATMAISQCDVVADWFKLQNTISEESYKLVDAIEIASTATKNVHRAFGAEVIKNLPPQSLPLNTSGLAVLTDCLFIIFENAWKHSDLGRDLPPMELRATFDPDSQLLTLITFNALSDSRRRELLSGKLTNLRDKYLNNLPLELISLEGGSGFPKLARLAYSVSRITCPHPFDFGIENNKWFTRVTVPLYERDGVFEAYE